MVQIESFKVQIESFKVWNKGVKTPKEVVKLLT